MTTTGVPPAGWEAELANGLRAPATASTERFFADWAQTEHAGATSWGGVNEGGAENPFDTSYGSPQAGMTPPPGSSVYNSSGVMNYASWAQGMSETVAALEEPGFGYPTLLGDLRSGTMTVPQLEAAEEQTQWGTQFAPARPGRGYLPITAGGGLGQAPPSALHSTQGSPGGGIVNDVTSIPGKIIGGATSSIESFIFESLFVVLGLGLIVVGAYKAAGKDPPNPLSGLKLAAAA